MTNSFYQDNCLTFPTFPSISPRLLCLFEAVFCIACKPNSCISNAPFIAAFLFLCLYGGMQLFPKTAARPFSTSLWWLHFSWYFSCHHIMDEWLKSFLSNHNFFTFQNTGLTSCLATYSVQESYLHYKVNAPKLITFTFSTNHLLGSYFFLNLASIQRFLCLFAGSHLKKSCLINLSSLTSVTASTAWQNH